MIGLIDKVKFYAVARFNLRVFLISEPKISFNDDVNKPRVSTLFLVCNLIV